MKKPLITLFSAFILLILSTSANAAPQHSKFEKFLTGVRKEALSLGLSKKTVHKYLTHLKLPEPIKKTTVVKRQKHQAQAVLSFDAYLNRLAPKGKIKRAQKEYQRHKTLLLQIYRRYQVQPGVIVALWGLESDFGDYTGDFPLIRSLALLAFHHHRSKFYRRQLIDALMILDKNHVIPQMLKSSWDGGMGQTQFEPSAYIHYAVDYDHDGFKNIWTSFPDVFASIANFLHLNGWEGTQNWGIEVKVPKNFPTKLANKHIKYTINKWRQLGVRQLNGEKLTMIKGKAALLLPNGIKGRAFLVYSNFDVLLRWNNTTFEALVTGILSDKTASLPQRHPSLRGA